MIPGENMNTADTSWIRISTALVLMMTPALAFSTGAPLLGDLSNILLKGVGLQPAAGMSIPGLLFAYYQGTFAIVTAALIAGAVVERMRFLAYAAFISLWSPAVYSLVAHWVCGGR